MTDTLNIHKHITEHSRLGDVNFNNISFGKIYADHMFMCDYKQGAWRNARIVPYGQLDIYPAAAVLHYGQAVFEGLKAFKNNGKIHLFRPDMYANRLNTSAERMCIPLVPKTLFMEGLTTLLQIDKDWIPNNEGASLYIRPTIFATDNYIGVRPSDTYRFIIFTSPAAGYYSGSLKLKIETHYSRSCRGGTGFVKTGGNYAASYYPTRQAVNDGYAQVIWTDAHAHQHIEEAGTMNIMFVINDVLLTAQTKDTVLKGITRDCVLTIARDWGMKVEERDVSVEEIIKALRNGEVQEAFGTGTAATVTGINTISCQGQDYLLPELDEEKAFSVKAGKELNAIQSGLIPDSRQWVSNI